MKLITLICGAVIVLCPWNVYGHGIPVVVDIIDNKLTISGGTFDSAGFADWVFADGTEDAALAPAPGNVLLSDLPGFDVTGITAGNGLYLEVISRPVKDSNPLEQRVLWHWSAANEMVEIAPNNQTMSLLSKRALFPSVELPQESSSSIGPLLIGEPKASDNGVHVHLLYYSLDNNPTDALSPFLPQAALGAYGFFAKLSSPNYITSDPFLIVLNNGLSQSQVANAALAINAAAVPEPSAIIILLAGVSTAILAGWKFKKARNC